MGVSLERVQNKFACIIGELCNEPVVLSQFAIWVDMRLAEYKAKGSICLECCGDIPKPTWLKGLPLKDTDPEMLPVDEGWPPGMILDSTGQSNYSDEGLGAIIDHDGHSRRRPARPSNRQFHPASRRSDNGTPSSSHPNSPRTNLHADLPSDILIKQEAHDPSDNIQISSHSSDWRKRPSDTDYGSNISLQVKSQKLSSDVTPLNEPLSAIINRAELAESQSNSAIDKLSAMTEQSFNQSINTDDDDDIQVEIISGPSSILPASSNIIPYPGTSSADFSSHSAANNSELDSSRLSQNDSLMDSELANTSDMNVDYSRCWNLSSNLQTTSTNQLTQRKTASSVGLFQRWLASNKDEFRAVRAIPPVELDPYLVTFLTTCKKVDGGEYSAKSLKGLRESIERHLKESGYPESIVTSWAFMRSQTAYKTRFKQLLTPANPQGPYS